MKRFLGDHALIFVVLSLFLHLAVWQGSDLLVQKSPPSVKSVDIQFLSPEELSQLEKAENRGQVVEQDEKPLNDEIPEDTKFLAEHNQKVTKETKAAHSGKFNNSGGSGKLGGATKPLPPAEPQDKDSASLSPKFDRLPVAVAQQEPGSPGTGEASQSTDYLKDVDVGIQTLLNAREFKYATYYRRIREQIRQHWEPSIREKIRKILSQGRAIASSSDRITRVMVILDSTGKLLKVNVLGQSGIQDLDDAATDAFRSAEPFPNPPKGMIESDGTVKILWDFVLEASSIAPINDPEQFAKAEP